MAVRKFVFCDICNQRGIRLVEERRGFDRFGEGRRIADGRAWFEGTVAEASKGGWDVSRKQHICPRCQKRTDASQLKKSSVTTGSQAKTAAKTKEKIR